MVVNKFGKSNFGKRLKEYLSYGYCASKKEKYYGMKVHVITDLNGNPNDYLLTKANVDDRDALHELSDMALIDILLGYKGYIGEIYKELEEEKGIKLYV